MELLEKSVLQLDSFNQPNCGVATCGSNLNKFQIKLLIKECHPREVILCYDNEDIKKDYIYYEKLKNMCKKYTKYAEMSFIYDNENLTKSKDSPTDDGEVIFNKLISRRIKVK